MSQERRGVALTPMETRFDVIVRTARLADQLGYEVFALPEGWGFDSTLVLAQLARSTERIRLLPGVLSVWGRTPATLAMSAATLDLISCGRSLLGLGPSTKALAEGFHGTRFERPADKLREVTVAVRALLAGERVRVDPRLGARPLKLGQQPAPDLPIWLAAMGRRAIRVAAELGDGWFPLYLARDRFAELVPELRRRRAAAGARPGPLTVAAGPMTVADDDPDAARQAVATTTAWYLCAMGDLYAKFVTAQGYGAEVEAILAANPRPSPGHGLVPARAEAVLDQFTAHGTPSQVRAALAPWHGAVDVVMLGLPPGLPWERIEATLRAAAPADAGREQVGSVGSKLDVTV